MAAMSGRISGIGEHWLISMGSLQWGQVWFSEVFSHSCRHCLQMRTPLQHGGTTAAAVADLQIKHLKMPARGLRPISACLLIISLKLWNCWVDSALIWTTFSHTSLSLGSQDGSAHAEQEALCDPLDDPLRDRTLRRFTGTGGFSNTSESESDSVIGILDFGGLRRSSSCSKSWRETALITFDVRQNLIPAIIQ